VDGGVNQDDPRRPRSHYRAEGLTQTSCWPVEQVELPIGTR
jgi:hypothetical protein